MQLLLILCAFMWSPMLGLATLLLLMLLGNREMTKELRAALASISKSRRAYFAVSTSSPRMDELNKMARDYFLPVYGGSTLSPVVRKTRKVLAILLGLVATALLISALLGVMFGRTIHQLNPAVSTLVFVAEILGVACALNCVWLERPSPRPWPTACQATKDAGGPQKYLKEVEAIYGKIPEVRAWFLAPYQSGNFGSLVMAVGRGTGVLLTAAYFSWSWSGAAGGRQLGAYGIAVLAIFFLGLILMTYLAVFVFLNTSEWGGIQSGADYFPLQVLCRDLEEIRTGDADSVSDESEPSEKPALQ